MLDHPEPARKIGWLLLAGAMAGAVAFLFWLQRDLAYADDGFNWLALSGTGTTKTLIEPYGGHLIFIPMTIYRAGLEIFGTSYTGFGVIQIALLLLLSGLLYEYGRRRVGPLLALPAAVIVLFLGSSWNVLMQPMLGIQFFCGLVPGLAALLALERDDRRGDVAACALLVLATFSFEVGLAFVVGAAVGIALRDDRWRRAWIVAVPLLAYLGWRVWANQYGGTGLELANVLWLPAYAVDSLGNTAASLFGGSFWVGNSPLTSGQLTSLKLIGFSSERLAQGLFLLGLEVTVALLVFRALRRRGAVPATLWVALAILVTLWAEQGLALSPDRTPGEIRYVFQDVVVLLLVVLEAARGIKATRLALALALALTLAGIAGNTFRFKEGREVLGPYSPPTNAAIAVVNLGGANVPPEFNPSVEAPEAFQPERGAQFGAGPMQAVSEKFGSPGYSVAELLGKDESTRRSADLVAARALGLRLTPAADAPGDSCRRHEGRGGFELPAGGAILIADRSTVLALHRFAGSYAVQIGRMTPGRAMKLSVPRDAAAVPWQAIAPGAGSVTFCEI